MSPPLFVVVVVKVAAARAACQRVSISASRLGSDSISSLRFWLFLVALAAMDIPVAVAVVALPNVRFAVENETNLSQPVTFWADHRNVLALCAFRIIYQKIGEMQLEKRKTHEIAERKSYGLSKIIGCANFPRWSRGICNGQKEENSQNQEDG